MCLTTESRAKIFISIIEKVLLKYEYAKESIYSFNKHMLLQMILLFISIIENVLLKYEYAKESIYSFNKHMLLQMRHCPFEMT